MIIIIAVTILLFIFVILYITFAMKSKNLKGKVLLNVPVKVDTRDTAIQIVNGTMPKSMVGREYSYSTWMYLESFSQDMNTVTKTPYHKLIMYRGTAGDIASANPIVMMDGRSNKLYVIIKTTESSIASSTVSNDLNEILTKNYFWNQEMSLENPMVNKHIVLTIDYVPLQRWVHIMLVVDNKVMTLYLDGEIYSVKSTDEYKASRQPHVTRLGRTIDYNLIVEKTDGDLFIGKSLIGGKRTIDGYIAKVEFFNYALSVDKVKKVYQDGPLPRGLLAWLGLGQYGFRAPIYKLNQSVQ